MEQTILGREIDYGSRWYRAIKRMWARPNPGHGTGAYKR